jgi:hypothetical protein
MRTLSERCFSSGKHLDEAITSGRYLEAAEECKTKAARDGDDRYHITLGELFGRRVVTRRLAYDLLIHLPFSSYITTNYDPLLQYEARGTDCRLLTYPGLFEEPRDGRPLYYIHGCARRGEVASGGNLVLAQSEYDRAYLEPGIVQHFLVSKLATSHVLFIGTDLADRQLQQTLRTVAGVVQQIREAGLLEGLPRYYLLAALAERSPQRDAESFKSFGIDEILYYQQGDERHSGLEDFLERVYREVDVPLPQPIPIVKSGVDVAPGE